MTMTFCTIASGSSGNSAFISAGKHKILVDAGLSGKAIEEGLRAVGVNPKELTAIFVTHEHNDHLKGAGIMSRRYNIPVFLTAGTAAHTVALGKLALHNKRIVRADVAVHLDGHDQTSGLVATPFAVGHDANEPVGYIFTYQGAKCAIATDLGEITEEIAGYLQNSNIIAIEANYDIEMLKNGPYPLDLQRRIASKWGHLSNVACGQALANVICDKTQHIFLLHLSQDNNHPQVAYDTVENILIAEDLRDDVKLHIAPRHTPSNIVSTGYNLQEVLKTNEALWALLNEASSLGIQNYYFGAGCVNQTVWNYLSGYEPDYGIEDYDFVYFDSDLSQCAEEKVAKQLAAIGRKYGVQIDVCNQARVHLWHKNYFGYDVKPYKSCEDAISDWMTTASALGVRIEHGKLKIFAPYGLDDLFDMTLRPNKKKTIQADYELKSAKWKEKWTKLKVLDWEQQK